MPDQKGGPEGGLWYQGMSRVVPGCPQTSPRAAGEGRCIWDAYGGYRTSNIQHPTSNGRQQGEAGKSYLAHWLSGRILGGPGISGGVSRDRSEEAVRPQSFIYMCGFRPPPLAMRVISPSWRRLPRGWLRSRLVTENGRVWLIRSASVAAVKKPWLRRRT